LFAFLKTYFFSWNVNILWTAEGSSSASLRGRVSRPTQSVSVPVLQSQLYDAARSGHSQDAPARRDDQRTASAVRQARLRPDLHQRTGLRGTPDLSLWNITGHLVQNLARWKIGASEKTGCGRFRSGPAMIHVELFRVTCTLNSLDVQSVTCNSMHYKILAQIQIVFERSFHCYERWLPVHLKKSITIKFYSNKWYHFMEMCAMIAASYTITVRRL